MKCYFDRNLILRVADGEASRDEKAGVEEHLSQCSTCSRFYRLLNRMNQIHRDMAEQDPPARLFLSVIEQVKKYRRRIRAHNRLIRVAVPVFSVLIVILSVKVGTLISTILNCDNSKHAEALKLEYLDEHPPNSAGDIFTTVMEEKEDD